MTLRPAGGLAIRSSVTYTDSEVDGDDPVLGLGDGERVRYIPEWTLAVRGTYDFSLSSNLDAHLGAGARYNSGWDNEWGVAALGGLNIPTGDTMMVDVHMGLTVGGRYRVKLYATNLFDEHKFSRTSNLTFSAVVDL